MQRGGILPSGKYVWGQPRSSTADHGRKVGVLEWGMFPNDTIEVVTERAINGEAWLKLAPSQHAEVQNPSGDASSTYFGSIVDGEAWVVNQPGEFERIGASAPAPAPAQAPALVRAPAAPTITAFRGPPLLRFVLLPSNEVYARFADTLVHLNASAAAFSLLAPDGTSTRGLVRTATAAVRTRLALALHLRNALVAAAPQLVWEMLPPCRYFDLASDALGPLSWPRRPSPPPARSARCGRAASTPSRSSPPPTGARRPREKREESDPPAVASGESRHERMRERSDESEDAMCDCSL